ncbi:MAG: hypothetical protein WCE81_10050 [Halobacteriota archaeon]
MHPTKSNWNELSNAHQPHDILGGEAIAAKRQELGSMFADVRAPRV